jgi:hypothetical protein
MKKLLLILAISIPMLSIGKIYYVTVTGTGLKDGSSWTNAFAGVNLQSAINAASSGDQVWVAAGTYKPTIGTDRDISFSMKEGVAIYGGFQGTETTIEQRDKYGPGEINETRLSGDIGIGGTADNSYHVFYHPTGIALTNAALINGLTIADGNANGSDPHNLGGGMFNDTSSPTIENVVFQSNNASQGGGIYNYKSAPIISKTSFISNYANNGGGVCNFHSSPTTINSIFKLNSAGNGGGFYNDESPDTVINTILYSNSATKGGAIYDLNSSSITTNSTIAFNTSVQDGGAIFVDGTIVPDFNNCIVWGNSSIVGTGHQFYINGGDPRANFTCYSVGTGDVVGTLSTNDCINSDPKFIDPAGGDLRIFGLSGCVDAGNNTFIEGYDPQIKTDIRGQYRVQNTSVDMGAYEWTDGVDLIDLLYFVDAEKTDDTGSGLSWSSAKKTLQAALDLSTPGYQIWVKSGVYHPTLEYAGTGDRFKTFRMKDSVAIYGGFAGHETSVSERNNFGVDGENETILSGDLNNNNATDDNDCYHVILNFETLLTPASILDGFTITRGNANDPSLLGSGGGMFNASCSPTIRNTTFLWNYALALGGGLYNYHSSPIIINSVFKYNTAYMGGGMCDDEGSSSTLSGDTLVFNYAPNYGGAYACSKSTPTINNTMFFHNDGDIGGGAIAVFNTSSATFTNALILFNTSGNGGGIYVHDASVTVNNATITLNRSEYGGGIFSDLSSFLTLNNSILWDNDANLDIKSGKQMYIEGTTIGIGTVSFNHSCYSNRTNDIFNNGIFTATNNNITTNPLFVNTPILDYRIAGSSPCVNTGNNVYNVLPTDIRGEVRIQNSTIDMGAFEWTSGLDSNIVENSLIMFDWTYYPGEVECIDATNKIFVEPEDSVVLESGSNITYIAGKSIHFHHGFKAKEGCYMHAYITTDGTFCDRASSSIVATEPIAVKSAVQDETVGKAGFGLEKTVKVYPNPNNGQFVVEISNFGQSSDIAVYNMIGQVVYRAQIKHTEQVAINLPFVQRGVYNVVVNNGLTRKTTKMIVN